MININDLIYWFIYCLHSYIVKVQNGKVSSDVLSNYIYIEYWNVQFLCSVIINKAKVYFPFSDICAISRFCYHVAVLTSKKKCIWLTIANCTTLSVYISRNVWRNMLDSEDTWSNEYGCSFRMCEECVGIDTNLNLNKAQWVNEPSQYIDF
jgi:hypothetical protein